MNLKEGLQCLRGTYKELDRFNPFPLRCCNRRGFLSAFLGVGAACAAANVIRDAMETQDDFERIEAGHFLTDRPLLDIEIPNKAKNRPELAQLLEDETNYQLRFAGTLRNPNWEVALLNIKPQRLDKIRMTYLEYARETCLPSQHISQVSDEKAKEFFDTQAHNIIDLYKREEEYIQYLLLVGPWGKFKPLYCFDNPWSDEHGRITSCNFEVVQEDQWDTVSKTPGSIHNWDEPKAGFQNGKLSLKPKAIPPHELLLFKGIVNPHQPNIHFQQLHHGAFFGEDLFN